MFKSIFLLFFVVSAVSSYAIDKVVFSWIDENGATQSVVDTQAPWALPSTTSDGKFVPFAFLATPGKKVITATAFSSDQVVKTKVLEFDVVDSAEKSKQCDNLIANSDMIQGYKGYWKPALRGRLTDANEVVGESATAIRHTRRWWSSSGPTYLASKNIDYSCLTPGSKWQIYSQVLLLGKDNDGVACTLNVDCPRIDITITDGSGKAIATIASRDYVDTYWHNDSWNKIQKVFTLPSSSEWDGTIGSVSIEIKGYQRATDLVIDQFSILPV